MSVKKIGSKKSDLFQVIMGFEFTKSELVEFYCIFGKPQPQANILHYSPYTQLVRSEKIPKNKNNNNNNN